MQEFHFYTLNRAELTRAICRSAGHPRRHIASRNQHAIRRRYGQSLNSWTAIPVLDKILKQRILLLDGAMGTMIQSYGLRSRISAASVSRITRAISRATTISWR